MGFTTLTPALPRLLEHFADVPHVEILVPALATVPYLALAIFSPIIGAVSDRFGRRNLLLAAASVYGLSGVAPFFLDNLYAILATRFLVGVSEAAIQTLSLVLIGDYFQGAERRRWITLQPPLLTIGSAALTSISGMLADISWRMPFLIYGVTFLMLIAIYLFIWEPDRRGDAEEHAAAKVTSRIPLAAYGFAALTFIVSILLINGPIQFGFVATQAGIASSTIIGNCLAIGALVGVSLGALIYNALPRLPNAFMFALCIAAGALGLIGLANFTTVPLFALALIFVNLGFGMLMMAMMNAVLAVLPVERRGGGMGMWSMALFAGEFAGPFAAASANTVTGSLTQTLLVFGLALLAIAAGTMLWRVARPGAQVQTEGGNP